MKMDGLAVARIREIVDYDMADADASDQEDFRVVLGNGHVPAGETKQPRRYVESAKVKDPESGEWVNL